MVALLLTLEGGGTSLCSPSREYVSWLGVRRHTETLPSCSCRSRMRGLVPGAARSTVRHCHLSSWVALLRLHMVTASPRADVHSTTMYVHPGEAKLLAYQAHAKIHVS